MKKTIVLFYATLFILILSGCTNENNEIQETEGYNMYTSTFLFSSLDSSIGERVGDSSINNSVYRYILGNNAEKMIMNDLGSVGSIDDNILYNDFFFYNFETQEMKTLLFPEITLDGSIFRGCYNNNGSIFLHDIYKSQFYLLDEEGKLLAQTDYAAVKIDFTKVANTYFSSDSNFIYIANGNELAILNYNLDTVFFQSEKDTNCEWKLYPNINQSCMLSKDNKRFYFYDEGVGLSNAEFHLSASLSKKLELERDGLNIYAGDSQYDFYCQTKFSSNEEQENSIDFLGIKDGIAYKLFSYHQMGFDSQYITGVASDGNGGFIISYANPLAYNQDFYYLKPCDEVMDYSLENNKETITIAGIFAPAELKKAVLAFNNTSKDYYIELVEYSNQYEDTTDAYNALYLDVAVNQCVDAILLYGLDKTSFTTKDILLDLNDYFSGNHAVTKTDFEKVVWENMPDADGKITSVYPEFSLVGWLSAQKLDLENLNTYTNPTADGQLLFAGDNATSQFINFMRYSGNQFIDEETGETHFEEEFVTLLELLKAGEDAKLASANVSDTSAVLDKQAMSLFGELNMPYAYSYYSYLFDSSFYCTNYGTDAPILVPSMSEFGITSYSKHIDGMYSFLDFILTEENYHKYFGKLAFPVLQSISKDWLIRVTATENYTNRFGEEIMAGTFTYSINNVSTNLSSMSNDEAALMQEMVQSAVYVKPLPSKYTSILYEEVQYYFNDERTANEVCEVLENRLSTALNE